jgi:hypothetical protein
MLTRLIVLLSIVCLLLSCFAFPQTAVSPGVANVQSSVTNSSSPGSTSVQSSVASSTTVQSSTSQSKYLVEILPLPKAATKAPGPAKFNATKPSRCDGKVCQTITFKAPDSPHFVGETFAVDASSDSGLPVTITVISGNATIDGHMVTVKGDGDKVSLRATQPGDARYGAAPEVPKEFTVKDDPEVCRPALIPAQKATPKDDKPLDASAIIPLLGNNPYPFSFEPAGKDRVFVYSARMPLKRDDHVVLQALKKRLDEIVSLDRSVIAAAGPPSTTPAYEVKVRIPHAAAFGDLAARFTALNYSKFSIQNVGADQVRISSAKMPDCITLTALLKDIGHIVWSVTPESPVQRVFFLGATDASAAAGGAGTGSGASQTGASGAGSSATPTSTTAAPPGGGATTSANAATAASSASPAASTPAASMPAQSSTSSAATSPSKVAATAVGSDFLVFTGAAAGDESAYREKKRILALLDLPRPEMLITTWSVQISSSDSESIRDITGEIRARVKTRNAGLQKAIDLGWMYLTNQISNPSAYFDHDFYRYIAGRFVAEDATPMPDNTQYQKAAERVIFRDGGATVAKVVRDANGICAANQYCLGYSSIFQPLKPRLTDLLLAVIAAKDPQKTTNEAIDLMENVTPAIRPADCDCDARDSNGDHGFYLECFRKTANDLFDAKTDTQPRPIGLLRAALADFLFHYKMALQYPHEFTPYDLSQSAQTLNTALSPLVDAFNRDVANYQSALEKDVRANKTSWVGGEKTQFAYNGLLTVRTVSGKQTKVSTTTQNFVDASQMPTVSDLLKSVEGSHAPAGSSGITDLLQNISPIQAQLILGGLNAYQTSKVQIGRGLTIDVTARSLSGASAAEIDVVMNADETAAPTYYSGPQSGTNAELSRVAVHDTSTRVRVDSIKLFEVSTLSAMLQKSRSRFPLLPPLVEIPYIGTVLGIPLPQAKEYHSSIAVVSAIVVPTAADLALSLRFTDDRFVDLASPNPCGQTGQRACELRKMTALSDVPDSRIRAFHREMTTCLATEMGYSHPSFTASGAPAVSPACSALTFDLPLIEAQ